MGDEESLKDFKQRSDVVGFGVWKDPSGFYEEIGSRAHPRLSPCRQSGPVLLLQASHFPLFPSYFPTTTVPTARNGHTSPGSSGEQANKTREPQIPPHSNQALGVSEPQPRSWKGRGRKRKELEKGIAVLLLEWRKGQNLRQGGSAST